MKYPPNIIEFYQHESLDSENRSLNEIWNFSDEDLMHGHDWVQWLFPLENESAFNPDAPILRPIDITIFNKSVEIQENLRTSFFRFLKMLNLRWEDDKVLGESDVWFFKTVNHNWLRFTRVIKSLTVLGLKKEATAFYSFLSHNVEKNEETMESHNFWRKALD